MRAAIFERDERMFMTNRLGLTVLASVTLVVTIRVVHYHWRCQQIKRIFERKGYHDVCVMWLDPHSDVADVIASDGSSRNRVFGYDISHDVIGPPYEWRRIKTLA